MKVDDPVQILGLIIADIIMVRRYINAEVG
jgi:hypothetical protein